MTPDELVEKVAMQACCPCSYDTDLPLDMERCAAPCTSCLKEARAALAVALEQAAKQFDNDDLYSGRRVALELRALIKT